MWLKLFLDNLVFGSFRTSSEIFGYVRVVFVNPGTPRIKSHTYNSEKVGRYTTLVRA